MTQRERILAGGIVGVLGVGALLGGVRALFLEPRRAALAQLAAEERRAADLENHLNRELTVQSRWLDRVRGTLRGEANEAAIAFRDDVSALLNKHGLTADLTTSPRGQRVEEKAEARRGFTELSLQVSVKGKLEQLVGFLRELYQRPYEKRVARITLGVEGGLAAAVDPKKRGKNRGEPRLNITMTLVALHLPRTAIPAAAGFDPREPGEFEPLALPQEPEAYDEIVRINPFKLFEPEPRVAVKPTPESAPASAPTREVAVKPRPKARPDHHLVATVSLNGEPLAYIDESKRTDPPAPRRLNDEVADGKLVLIHPRGVVLRVREGDDVNYYFYGLGASFKDRGEEVGPGVDPDVARQLKLVLKQ